MKNEQAEPQPPSQGPRSNHPALSISAPPPRSQRVVTYVLSGLLIGTLVLTLAAVIAYWLGPR